MDFIKIILIIIGIPLFIFTIIPMIIQFWAEGQVIDALMSAFNVHPILSGLITIAGFLFFFLAIIGVAKSFF